MQYNGTPDMPDNQGEGNALFIKVEKPSTNI
jgi:hypothetical protein